MKSSNPPRAEGIDSGNDLDGDSCADLCHGGFRNLHHFFVVAGRYWDLRIGEEEERRRLKKGKSSLVGFFLGAKLFQVQFIYFFLHFGPIIKRNDLSSKK